MSGIVLDAFESALRRPEIENAWYDNLALVCDPKSPQWSLNLTYVTTLRQELLDALHDMSDPEERDVVFAMFYLRLRGEWALLNRRIGYQFQQGRQDEATIVRASMLAVLCSAVEDFLSRKVVDYLSLIADNPLESPESELSLPTTAFTVTTGGDSVGVVPPVSEASPTQDAGSDDRPTMAPAVSTDGGLDDLTAYAALLQEREQLRTEQEALLIAVGVGTVTEAIRRIRQWSESWQAAQAEYQKIRTRWEGFQREFGGRSPREVLKTLQDLSKQVAVLQQKLGELQASQAFLERETGTTNALAIVEMLQNLREQLAEREEEAAPWQGFRDYLEREIGVAEPVQVVAAYHSAQDANTLLRERLTDCEVQMTLLQEKLGANRVEELVTRFHEMEARARNADEFASILGSMDEVLKSLDATTGL